jgi:hypothetical protein
MLLIISANESVSVYAQHLVIPNRPYTVMRSSPGYLTINEFTVGVGLKEINELFSESFFGLNTIHSYQINRNFIIGAGTGIAIYNGCSMIPLFADFRFNFSIHSSLTQYLSGDGGLLLNPSENEKLFINPGTGIRYSLNKYFALNLGASVLLQVDEVLDTYLNFRFGLTFKPSRWFL